MGGKIHTIKKNSEALAVASKEIGLEVNGETTKYVVMAGDRNVGQKHNMKLDNECLKGWNSSNV